MHKRLLTTLFVFVILIVGVATPTLVLAQTPPTPPSQTPAYQVSYVPCGTDDVDKDGRVDNPCGFIDIIVMAKRAITGWIMAGVTFATMGFAYAGYLYITAMGSQEKISHAHSIFAKTAFGFVFMLSAWLIAYAMESIFLTDTAKERSFLQP